MNLFRKLLATAQGIASHPLHQEAKLRAVCQFGVRQLAARFVSGDVCVSFPNDTRLLIPTRMKGAAHFIMPGLCEFEPMCFVAHFLRSEDLFIDVGANLGAYTILASGVAQARSVAVEPSPTTYRYLQLNISLNELEQKVRPHHAALAAQAGTLQLTEGRGTENAVCLQAEQARGVSVKTTTLDLLLHQERPTLIKVDVEGYEPEVFAGGTDTLRQESLRALIIERAGNASRYGQDEAKLHQEIQHLGFVPCAYLPLARQLITLPPHSQGNIIYLKDPATALKRLQESASFQFAGHKI